MFMRGPEDVLLAKIIRNELGGHGGITKCSV